MSNDQNETCIGSLEGTIEKAYITVLEIPRVEIPNETGMGLYIGGDQNDIQ